MVFGIHNEEDNVWEHSRDPEDSESFGEREKKEER
jgi:hypothetical protein